MTEDEKKLRKELKPEVIEKIIADGIDLSKVNVGNGLNMPIWISGTNHVLDYQRKKGLI